jgi:SAM-dependent methyltransferase
MLISLSQIAAEFPEMPGRSAIDSPQHPVYIQRSAFDLALAVKRAGTAGKTIVDIGGGVGLFSLGAAKLGARSILVDDFKWLRQQQFGDEVFALFDRYGVEVVERDVITDGLEFPEQVDAVTNFHFMEHVHNSPKRLFHDVAEHLVPGGVFVLAGPNCVNLRKRVTVPLGKGQWSTMEHWYEAPEFRGHVREPDVATLRYIARDMNLVDVEIIGRNFLGLSRSGLEGRVARAIDPVLQHRPALCSDIYLAARKAD